MYENEVSRLFNEALHKRGMGAQGGQFVASDGTKSKSLGYDGKAGSGYGRKGGDSNVRRLQRELNRLGITDSGGKSLAVDGKFGPKTTAAVKRLQRKLKLPADGKITPALLARVKRIKKVSGNKVEGGRVPEGAGKKAPAKKAGTAPVRKAAQQGRAAATKKAATVKKAVAPKKAAPVRSAR